MSTILCIVSTDADPHPGDMLINGLWYCTPHGERHIAMATPPKNLDQLVRKIRRRPRKKQLELMATFTEHERVWVSKRLAGG